MAINRKDLLDFTETIAPLDLQEEWDNSGWQLDLGADSFSKIYISLDINRKVIEDAKAQSADLILAHHPMLIEGQRAITTDTLYGEYIESLILAGISVYAAHTSYDAAPSGMNDKLAGLLGLEDITTFAAIGRVGRLSEPREASEVAELAKNKLGLSSVRMSRRAVGLLERQIRTVAICGGGGGSLVDAAIATGCDLYLTGEVRHHEALSAMDRGLIIVEAGHFGSEKIFIEDVSTRLGQCFGSEVLVIASQIDTEPFYVI